MLLAAAKEHLALKAYTLLLTALRADLCEGELAGLKWEGVHFGDSKEASDRFLLVQRNYDRRWSKTMVTPKSSKSRRVDMSKDLRQTLLTLKAQANSSQLPASDLNKS